MIPVDVIEVVGNDRRKLGTVSLNALVCPRCGHRMELTGDIEDAAPVWYPLPGGFDPLKGG